MVRTAGPSNVAIGNMLPAHICSSAPPAVMSAEEDDEWREVSLWTSIEQLTPPSERDEVWPHPGCGVEGCFKLCPRNQPIFCSIKFVNIFS